MIKLNEYSIEEIKNIENIEKQIEYTISSFYLLRIKHEDGSKYLDYFNVIMKDFKNFTIMLDSSYFWPFISNHYNLNTKTIYKYHHKLWWDSMSFNKFIIPYKLNKIYKLFKSNMDWNFKYINRISSINLVIKFHHKVDWHSPDRDHAINKKLMKYFKNCPHIGCSCRMIKDKNDLIYFHHKMFFSKICDYCLKQKCIFYKPPTK